MNWFRQAAFLCAGVFTALGSATAARAELSIVATIPDLGAVAKAVGGDLVNVRVLATATEDPHFVDPRPSFLVALSKADVLIVTGLELEIGWLPALLVNARNAKIGVGGSGNIDASTLVTKKLGVPTGPIDRSMGDVHPGGNPHYCYGPDAMSDVARGIATRLGQLDAAHAETYQANARAFANDLQALAVKHKVMFAALAPERRKVVVYHDSLAYLVQWLGLEQVATIEDRPGIKPSPGHVADVLKRIKGQGVKAIVQEEFHPESTSQTLARLGVAILVKVPGGSREATAKGYLAMLDGVANAIYGVLTR